MNHLKVYNDIILKAKSENRQKLSRNSKKYVYYENHHIIPRCLGGSDENENLILLTPKEHYVCHKLLTYIYKGNLKIAQAFFLMIFYKKKKIKLSLRDYVYAKELIVTIPHLEVSEETRKKISKMLKLSPEERAVEKKKEKKQKKFNKWFDKNYSPEKIQKYLNSLKHVHYSPDFDRTIHMKFNR